MSIWAVLSLCKNMDFFFQPKISFFWGVRKIDKKKSTFSPPYGHLVKIFWTLFFSRFFGRIDVNLVFAGFLATSDLHFMGVICFVLASPLTTGSMCCIYGALWALLSFLWSFIDPGTWVKTANRRWFHWFRAFTGVSGHFCLTPYGGNMLRACFSAHYWDHVLHIWGFLGVIVVCMVIYRPWDLG